MYPECVCVCGGVLVFRYILCVCGRETEREGGEGLDLRFILCVCVCVWGGFILD